MRRMVITGFGRFGQLFADISKTDFEVEILEIDDKLRELAQKNGYKVVSVDDISHSDVICLAVPISKIEETIKSIQPFVKESQLVMDVCSVKVYPAQLMKKYLTNCQTLATHPLFGPDSAKNGLKGLKLVLCPLRVSEENVNFWKNFWTSREVEVIVTTPEKHDEESIYSQGFTYTIAKIINNMDISDLTFTTRSYEAIKRVADLSANDTDQLFHDMLYYNPYFKSMKEKFENAVLKTRSTLDKIENEQIKKEPSI